MNMENRGISQIGTGTGLKEKKKIQFVYETAPKWKAWMLMLAVITWIYNFKTY